VAALMNLILMAANNKKT